MNWLNLLDYKNGILWHMQYTNYEYIKCVTQLGFDHSLALFIVIVELHIATDKRGIHIIFFLFLDENICCEYSLEVCHRGASNEYPQSMFLLRNKKTIRTFRMKKASYLERYIKTDMFKCFLILMFNMFSAYKFRKSL